MEFALSLIKIVAVIGFIILGIVIDCGGVKTDPRGYIGAEYWHNPGAFNNGFQGFCSVFVTGESTAHLCYRHMTSAQRE